MASSMENTSFLFGANEAYIAELYAQFLKDRGSVDGDWADFFSELDDDSQEFLKDRDGASWSPRETSVVGGGNGNGSVSMSDATAGVTQMTPPPWSQLSAIWKLTFTDSEYVRPLLQHTQPASD